MAAAKNSPEARKGFLPKRERAGRVPPTLRGERVLLRELREDDLGFCVAFANDPELRGWLRFERPMTEEGERAWLHGLSHSDEPQWLMAVAATGAPAGIIGLMEWDKVARHAELGLGILDPAARGRGIGGEAIRLVLRHAFHDLNLQRVHLRVHEDNPARRLYARAGFREEGVLRRDVYKRGAYRDAVVMGILREEWSA